MVHFCSDVLVGLSRHPVLAMLQNRRVYCPRQPELPELGGWSRVVVPSHLLWVVVVLGPWLSVFWKVWWAAVEYDAGLSHVWSLMGLGRRVFQVGKSLAGQRSSVFLQERGPHLIETVPWTTKSSRPW